MYMLVKVTLLALMVVLVTAMTTKRRGGSFARITEVRCTEVPASAPPPSAVRETSTQKFILAGAPQHPPPRHLEVRSTKARSREHEMEMHAYAKTPQIA